MQYNRRYIFGEWHEARAPISDTEAREICDKARVRAQAFANCPVESVLRTLKAVGELWADPTYEERRRVREELPHSTGFSQPMIDLALDELPRMLSPDSLGAKLRAELGDIPRLPAASPGLERGTFRAWHPIGTVFHVLAGNVFLGAAGSLIEGLITGNVSILKMPSSDNSFVPAFIESLQHCDEDGVIASSIAALDLSSSNEPAMRALKHNVDAVVVWGGEAAVQGIRSDLPARTRLVVFGPKLSFAVVTRSGAERFGVEALGERLAGELAVWDQYACTAPQACFVEGEELAQRLGSALAQQLDERQQTLPAGPADAHTGAEIQKLRGVAQMREIRGHGALWHSPGNVDWTVVCEKEGSKLDASPLHRSIRLLPYSNLTSIDEACNSHRGYVQSVGIAAGRNEAPALSRHLLVNGALRVVPLGSMAGSEADEPHDGARDLPQLMNLVAWKLDEAESLSQRIEFATQNARRAPAYQPQLTEGALRSPESLAEQPILSRDRMEANMPPTGDGLATRDYHGGSVTRSGGSTGDPKFSVFDGADWQRLVEHGTQVFRALGLSPGDRVANCMSAGDMYGSFVSFDHINVALGLTCFNFAHQVTPEAFVDVWRRFALNAIEGIPSSMVPMLRRCKELEPALEIDVVVFAGAPMSQADYQWLKTELKARRVASVIGATDSGQFAYQCEHLDGTRAHHSTDDYNYVEAVDESGRPVPAGESGTLVLTTLQKSCYPLIRYDIGDRGRFLQESCPCGRPDRVFLYEGRSNTMLSIGLTNFEAEDVCRALDGLPIGEVQMVARSSAVGDYMLVRVECAPEQTIDSETIRETLVQRVPSVAHALESNSITRLEIEVGPPGSIPRNPRTGKTRRATDER